MSDIRGQRKETSFSGPSRDQTWIRHATGDSQLAGRLTEGGQAIRRSAMEILSSIRAGQERALERLQQNNRNAVKDTERREARYQEVVMNELPSIQKKINGAIASANDIKNKKIYDDH